MFQIPNDEKNAAQAEMLHNRLKKRYRHLKKWAKRTGTEVFRLYDRDIPEIPLVLDLYRDVLSLALYKRPYEKAESEEKRWLTTMQRAISEALDIKEDLIILKERGRQRGSAQYDKLQERSLIRDVREGGLTFRVNLTDYLDTGLFPDRRLMRAMVRSKAAGKRILNLFCYTASFSVYAAVGNARTIDSVDMSQTYLDWGLLNFELNHFAAKKIHPRELAFNTDTLPPYRFIPADILRFLPEARKAALTWDLIILDPPTFSNSKKMETTLDINRDYQALISQCLSLLSPGGTLWFSTNARHFRLDAGEFPEARIEDITGKVRDEDFTGRKIPACYVFTKGTG
ncbi:rRNA (guanine-N2)-methyltransferase [Spirochaetia bacterium]|nr:rRNA (guanine-N2)-methyltransferase [Spirochaetia bacterium]